MDENIDLCAKTGQSFIDAVVDHLIDQVVQTFGSGAPDIHGRALPDSFQSFEDFDTFGCIFFVSHFLTVSKKRRIREGNISHNPVDIFSINYYTFYGEKSKEKTL